MEYRILETAAELTQAVQVEIAVWGLQPLDAVPSSMLRALIHGGGLLLGAWDGALLVGVALAFPARSNNETLLWSHMTGVLPAYQGRDIGFTLKQKQREWALANGYNQIGWTFDPMKRGNANFNLHRLGATAKNYLVNFYGTMDDALNAGTPTDRLEALWQLDAPRVTAIANAQPPESDYPSLSIANTLSSGQQVNLGLLSSGLTHLFVELPRSSSPGQAVSRAALREALQAAFAAAYAAVDFVEMAQRFWYVLHHL